MFGDEDTWRLLVKIHNYTKLLLLKAEEVDDKFTFFFPPLVQHRDALDHIMRAAYSKVFPAEYAANQEEAEKLDGKDYADRQLDKALGHAYRAFFDAADWLGMVYRERMRIILSGYSAETINDVLNDFAATVQPRIERISLEIAALRGEKDIGNKKKLIGGADKYFDLTEELERYWLRVVDARVELDRRGCTAG